METKLISPINNSYVNSAKPTDKKEEQKQKTSSKVIKGVSIAAALGVTALAIGGLIYKNKISPNTLKLNGAIDFREAKTLQEAIEYGTNKLGIKSYEGFLEQDLDVVNWINDGLTRCANNAQAKGQVVMPKKILFEDMGNIVLKSGKEASDLSSVDSFGTFGISKNAVSEMRDTVVEMLKKNGIKVNPKKLNYTKTCKLFADMLKRRNIDTGCWEGTYSVITHEMGHLQHRFNLKNLRAFHSLGTPEQRPEKLAKGAKELLELFESKQDVAGKVSTYAKESPLEFVAEVFSQLAHGIKPDDDVMELYKKLGGVV